MDMIWLNEQWFPDLYEAYPGHGYTHSFLCRMILFSKCHHLSMHLKKKKQKHIVRVQESEFKGPLNVCGMEYELREK